MCLFKKDKKKCNICYIASDPPLPPYNLTKIQYIFHYVLLISVWETHKSFAVLVCSYCANGLMGDSESWEKWNTIPDNIERNIMHRSTKRQNCWHLKARLVCAVVKKSMPKSPNYSLNIQICCHCSCGNGRFLALTFVVIE